MVSQGRGDGPILMQRHGFLPIDVRGIHPYPTLAGRRDAVRAFDVVLSDAARQFRLSSCSASAASRFSMPVIAPARSLFLFIAQQRGQCGGVGELPHRRSDFAHGEVLVIVDGEFISGQAAGENAGAVHSGPGGACPFSRGDLLALKQRGKESTAASATVPTRERLRAMDSAAALIRSAVRWAG